MIFFGGGGGLLGKDSRILGSIAGAHMYANSYVGSMLGQERGKALSFWKPQASMIGPSLLNRVNFNLFTAIRADYGASL